MFHSLKVYFQSISQLINEASFTHVNVNGSPNDRSTDAQPKNTSRGQRCSFPLTTNALQTLFHTVPKIAPAGQHKDNSSCFISILILPLSHCFIWINMLYRLMSPTLSFPASFVLDCLHSASPPSLLTYVFPCCHFIISSCHSAQCCA